MAEETSEQENEELQAEELIELLKTKQYSRLRREVADMNEADIAAIMDSMEDEDSLKMFRILPKDLADAILLAKRYGADWLMIDCDAEPDPDLLQYAW